MKRFRAAIFWLHLVCGVVAGVVIAIMSFTGAALAFETEIIAWAERDAARVSPPVQGAPRLALEELAKRVRETKPEARPSGITVKNDPGAVVAFTLGRAAAIYVDPYSGEVREPGAPRVRAFMRTMEDWHRWLGRDADHRAFGRAITGACNAAFLVLAVSGLYLWFPRQWPWRVARRSVWFVRGARGKARDWNWHNTIGLWSAPVLIVLTFSGVVMSYRWANDLVYKLSGSEPPSSPVAAALEVAPPAPDAKPLGYDALIAAAQKQIPEWKTMTLRLNGGARGSRGGEARPGATRAVASRADETRRRSDAPARGSQAISISVRGEKQWPLFASTTLMLDPFTGDVLRDESFADQSAGRRARSWLRFLHTGEAFGIAGKFVAGLASLGALVLVYSGFALAVRRFFGRRRASSRERARLQPAAVRETQPVVRKP